MGVEPFCLVALASKRQHPVRCLIWGTFDETKGHSFPSSLLSGPLLSRASGLARTCLAIPFANWTSGLES
jgi:hypothetical protein